MIVGVKKFIFSLFLFLPFSELHSQLCNGSLGDPIIDITFGAGSNPGPALTTTANLEYVGYDCPNDGSYTITNSTSSCFGSTWYNIYSDHTGNPQGYFMLINASLQKSVFYIDTVRGLCPNTTYEYAAWLMNVILPSACGGNTISPNLTFNIEKTDGTILQTYNTGDLYATPIPAWRQYGFFFSTPAGASDIVVRISNNSPGGCGNDLAIDDITFRPCGAKLSPFIIGVEGDVKVVCKGDNTDVTLSAKISSGYVDPAFQWQQSIDNGSTFTDIPGATAVNYVKNIVDATPAGNYLFRLVAGERTNISSSSCRIASNALTIKIDEIPVTTAVSNSPVCEGTPVILTATGGAEYEWTSVNNFSAAGSSVTINNAAPNNAGKYYVTVMSEAGCKKSDSTAVIILPAPVASVSATRTNICFGDSVALHSSGGISYLWLPSAGLSSSIAPDVIATPADTIAYTAVVKNDLGCTDSAAITINVVTPPKANAGPDQDVMEGQSVQLQASATGGELIYRWTPDRFIDNADSLRPVVSPVNDITYYLTVTSNTGCGVSYDSVKVHVFKKVIVPNAFSPNGDGTNDVWNIKAINTYNDYELSVFNRYGRIVYLTKNYSKAWDGTFNGNPLPFGTYYYLIDLKKGLPKLKGFVVIIR